MKKSNVTKRGPQDGAQQATQQPDKVGWVRKFCGRGIFRELWRNRYVVLRGDQLYVSEKEVKDERKAQEVFDLADYERSEELRKAKSRSKKNHSRFTLQRCRQPGYTVPNLVFLAVSPEEKESWINALNVAIIKAKNRILDEVTVEEDSVLVHPTRDRVKIPHSRRLPTRGHILAVASTSSHGMLTLDLVGEEEGFSPGYGDAQEVWENSFRVALGGRQRSGTDVSKLRASREPRVKTGSLPRGSERSWGKQPHLEAPQLHNSQQADQDQAQSRTPQLGKRFSMQARSRCASMDEVLSSRPAMIRSEFRSALRRCPTEEGAGQGAGQPVGQLQSLIAQRMQRAQELLEEMRIQELQKAKAERGERGGESPYLKGIDSPRLHHLRGAESPHSSRSSDSPRLRGKDSPRLRGRESPRSRAKRNHSKGTDSPRSRGSQSPAARSNGCAPSPPLTVRNSPQTKSSDSVRFRETDLPDVKGTSGSPRSHQEVDSPICKSSESSPSLRGADSSQVKGGGSPHGNQTDSPLPRSSKESPSQSFKNSPSLSKSFDSPQMRSHGSPLAKASGFLRQKSLDSSHSPQHKTPNDHLLTPPLLASPSLSPPSLLSEEVEVEVERRRAEAERLLEEAVTSWKEAQEVLLEVKELQSQTLRRQRRRTYEKMSSTTAADGSPTATATSAEDTPTSPTSLDEDGELETP
ncbi:pleckstrin homology domain-containing family O member 1-A [Polymixia lowei]